MNRWCLVPPGKEDRFSLRGWRCGLERDPLAERVRVHSQSQVKLDTNLGAPPRDRGRSQQELVGSTPPNKQSIPENTLVLGADLLLVWRAED
jgi:hypothetical protein